MNREPLTIDEVLDPPRLVYHFRLRDCCLVTDVGGAFRIAAEHLDRCFLVASMASWPLRDSQSFNNFTARSMSRLCDFSSPPLVARITVLPARAWMT